MSTSSDVYVNLRDFADDIHELLPQNFILNYLILSKYSLDCHITEKSQSFFPKRLAQSSRLYLFDAVSRKTSELQETGD